MEQALNMGLTPNEFRKTYKKDLLMIQSIRTARNKKQKMVNESNQMMKEIKNG